MVLAAVVTQRGATASNELEVGCQVSLQLTPTKFSARAQPRRDPAAGSVWQCAFPEDLRDQVRPNMNLRFRWQVFANATVGG